MDALGILSESNLGSEDETDYVEVPSFLESLANSASQLKELSRLTSQHYIRALISYGHINEVKNSDQQFGPSRGQENHRPRAADLSLFENVNKTTLESVSSLVDLLPLLRDLSGHVEKCFTTLEITFKRFNYHINKLSSWDTGKPAGKGTPEFKPPSELRFDPVFISIMDLLFALISLDETISCHTNIRQTIKQLKLTCQTILANQEQDHNLTEDKLSRLLELIRIIESTVCDENRSIFNQCLEHLQHLDLILGTKKVAKPNIKTISQHLDEFILFYADHSVGKSGPPDRDQSNLKSSQDTSRYLLLQSDLTPTIFMTSIERKILGLSSLYILNRCIFKKLDKKLAKAINKMLTSFKHINLISLAESNIFITLSEFLVKYLPDNIIESKTLNHLRGQDDKILAFDLANYFSEITLEAMLWLVKLRASNQVSLPGLLEHNKNPTKSSYRECQLLLDKSLSLIEEINTSVRSVIAVHLKYRKAITRNHLVLLLRLVALLKSIHLELEQNRTFIVNQQIGRDLWIRSNWRKLILMARKRSITSKYSDRKLDPNTSLILFGLCYNLINHLATDSSKSLLFMTVSILTSTCLNLEELNDLNALISQLQPDVFERLDNCSNCAHLYWNVPTFSVYYNYVFEEDPGNIGEIKYFHRAIDDIRSLFMFDSPKVDESENQLDWLAKRRDQYFEKLADELMDQFRVHTLDKVCQELEIELRLQTHRDLHLDGHNPFKRHLYNFKRIFSTPMDRQQFSLFGRTISLKQYVEQHLSEIYYNLTSIAPHDWFTYDCMISLAKQKYALQVIGSQMPAQPIDCGLDLIEITRNLARFVSSYSYDMSNQLFVEKCHSNRLSTSSAVSVISSIQTTTNTQSVINLNQSLNVLQIRHVSMSIQNHGFGLLNSAINCTYQLMKKLVSLISRQTSGDQLRALLAKQQQEIDSCLVGSGLSFDRALKLAKRFKVNQQQELMLELAGEGNRPSSAGPDLDQIRQSITQLGNSLAFMRLLKSGALNCASRSVDYLPDLDDSSSLRLGKLVRAELGCLQSSRVNCGPLVAAATNFDACLEDFEENFSPKTDYFSIVLRLFSEALNGEKRPGGSNSADMSDQHELKGSDLRRKSNTSGETNPAETNEQESPADSEINYLGEAKKSKGDRLKFFYLLVPSLTINFIDHIMNAKERVVSRSSANRIGALICDDGFSIGLAFLLIVLGQTVQFSKLDWFREVRDKFDTDRAEVEKRVDNSRNEESLRQTSSMTLRRLSRLKQEYEALSYNLRSALLLFRSSTILTDLHKR